MGVTHINAVTGRGWYADGEDDGAPRGAGVSSRGRRAALAALSLGALAATGCGTRKKAAPDGAGRAPAGAGRATPSAGGGGSVTKLPYAYSFESSLDLKAMLATLNRGGALTWEERDSDRYGDYLSTRLDEGTRFRIFANEQRYVLDVGYISTRRGAKSREALEEIVRRDVLPVVGARSVTPRESWD